MNKKLLLLALCFAGSSAFVVSTERWVTVEVAQQVLRTLENKAKETRKHIELASFFQWVLSLENVKEDEKIVIHCDEKITMFLAGKSFVFTEHTMIPELYEMIIPFVSGYRDPEMKSKMLAVMKKTLGGDNFASIEKQKREMREGLKNLDKEIARLRKQLGLHS
jgi:hypothetical protein